MEIYLIRHTSVDVPEGLCYGQLDVDPSESFERELELIKKNLGDVEGELCFSSPLTRCKKLANHLFNGIPVRYDDRLMEMSFGDWEGKRWQSIDSDQLNRWMNDFVHTAPPGGESFQEVIQRSKDWWEEVILQSDDNLFVITHAGVIRSIISCLLEIPPHRVFSLAIDYASVTHITLEKKNGVQINCINKTWHSFYHPS